MLGNNTDIIFNIQDYIFEGYCYSCRLNLVAGCLQDIKKMLKRNRYNKM